MVTFGVRFRVSVRVSVNSFRASFSVLLHAQQYSTLTVRYRNHSDNNTRLQISPTTGACRSVSRPVSSIDTSSTVEPLFYDHPQNQIGVVVKEGWSSTRGLTIL